MLLVLLFPNIFILLLLRIKSTSTGFNYKLPEIHSNFALSLLEKKEQAHSSCACAAFLSAHTLSSNFYPKVIL